MTDALPSLFQELILDHYRKPRNRGALEDATLTVAMYNPVCGDEIDLHVRIAEGRLEAIRFGGHGCSISQSSASMMTQQAGGRSTAELRELVELFKGLMQGSPDAARDRRLGDLRALQGVARFPVRIKCALLPWNALEEALAAHARGTTGPVERAVGDDAGKAPAGGGEPAPTGPFEPPA